jgi:hypothetical protein
VNDTLFGFFQSSHGLRQGDPLSPLLFVVVMESLSRMLNATMLQGLLTGFSVGTRNNEELVVNHLLFANDTLIFCVAQAEHVHNCSHRRGGKCWFFGSYSGVSSCVAADDLFGFAIGSIF